MSVITKLDPKRCVCGSTRIIVKTAQDIICLDCNQQADKSTKLKQALPSNAAHWYAEQVRGFNKNIKRGDGGGFLKIARAAGFKVSTKKQARIALIDRFGWPPEGFSLPKIVKIVPVLIKPPTPERNQLFRQSDEFLRSYEWRTVRMEVIKRDGAKCACCGATPETGAIINVDHIKPRKTHPELALAKSNLQVLCDACNQGKGNWDKTDWRKPHETN